MKKKIKEDKKSNRGNWLSTDSVNRLGIYLLSALLLLGILGYDRSSSEWNIVASEGDPAPRDVYAPFDFSFYDEGETEEVRRAHANRVLDVYSVNDDITKKVLKNLHELFAELDNAHMVDTEIIVADSVRNVLSDTSLRELVLLKDRSDFSNAVYATATALLDGGLINFSQKVELLNSEKGAITLRRGNTSQDKKILELMSLSEARDSTYRSAQEKYPRDRKLRNAFTEILTSLLEANVFYDEVSTSDLKEKAIQDTAVVQSEIKKNEIIMSRGSIVTKEQMMILKEINAKVAKKKAAQGIAGIGIIVITVLVVLGCFLYFFEQVHYTSLKDVMLINTIIVSNVLLSKVLLIVGVREVLLPVTLAGVLVAILLKPRVGLCVMMVVAVLTGVMISVDHVVLITSLVAGFIGIYMTLDVRHRSQFFLIGAAIGVVYFLMLFSHSLMKEHSFIESFLQARWGVVNGLGITILLFPSLFLYEKIFDVTTSITLLELSDLNHPLLKRLIIEAPGTYHHSLVVSNLAESACEAIGANSLLARVGAYFHDIGKIAKAEYFTENQASKDKNFHDSLSPRMSYFIITNHVKDGIELAKKYKLKNIIIDFIAQHHGTSIVYYFYRKAMDALKANENINISDFRYAGPKPQSKEIAVTLLADTVEAASRTLSEPTPASLQGLVDKVVNDKFLDNQLDECALTLLDVNKIKESFVRNLMAIFHTRVEYPELLHESMQGKIIS